MVAYTRESQAQPVVIACPMEAGVPEDLVFVASRIVGADDHEVGGGTGPFCRADAAGSGFESRLGPALAELSP
jgi:hypothetical protein